jgi:L-rhamnose mutarotase
MKYYLALDLKDDPSLIEEYERWHQTVWPEVLEQIKASGITACEIYRAHNRLVMTIDTKDDFSFEKKSQMDAANEKVQEWEVLMWKYQQAIPGTKPGEKWQLMKKIFSFSGI